MKSLKGVSLTGALIALFFSLSAGAQEEGHISLFAGIDIPPFKYTTNGQSVTSLMGRDFFNIGIRVGGDYWIGPGLAGGIEIIPEFDLKNSAFFQLPVVFYGKTQSGMGYGKAGFALNYLKSRDDVDLGFNVGGGAVIPLGSLAFHTGLDFTIYFRLYEIFINLAIRAGIDFNL